MQVRKFKCTGKVMQAVGEGGGGGDGRGRVRIEMIERRRAKKGDGDGIREAAPLPVSENWSGAVAVLGTEESRRSCIPR